MMFPESLSTELANNQQEGVSERQQLVTSHQMAKGSGRPENHESQPPNGSTNSRHSRGSGDGLDYGDILVDNLQKQALESSFEPIPESVKKVIDR